MFNGICLGSWQIMRVTSLLLTPGEHKDSTVALPRDTETQLWIYLMSQNIWSCSEHRYIIKLFQTDKVHNYKFGAQCRQSKGIISILTLLRDAFFKKLTQILWKRNQQYALFLISETHFGNVTGHWNFILIKIKH